MLEGKGTGLIRVTAHTHLPNGAESLLRGFAGVCLMTVATLQSALGHWVVEVESKLVRFPLMALTAQDGVVELQQASRLRFLLRLGRAQASQIDQSTRWRLLMRFPVDLMTSGAGDVRLAVLRTMPL
jgi:hypothetical protein